MAFQAVARICKLIIKKQSGMTLIELIIAMTVASIALIGVFFTWNYINTHIFNSEHRTQVETETDRIGSMVASQIRKSPQIIEWNESRIELINPNGSDTSIYYFNQGNLLLNGDTVKVLAPDAKVKVFKIKDLNENQGGDEKSMLLDLTLSIESRGRDSATSHHTIQLTQNSPKSTTENKWGF